jgi:hypothetical protein
VEVAIDEFEINGQARGQAGQKGEQRLAVRFTCGVELQHVSRIPEMEKQNAKNEF